MSDVFLNNFLPDLSTIGIKMRSVSQTTGET